MPRPVENNAEALYKQGLDEYKRKDYEQAISTFDRGLVLCRDRKLKYLLSDSKAAAMSHVPGWEQSAYNLSVRLCEQYGSEKDGVNAWKPWYRKACTLRALKLPHKALEPLAHAASLVSRLPSSAHPAKLTETLENLRIALLADRSSATAKRIRLEASSAAEASRRLLAQREAERKSRIDYTGLLGPDVLVCICEAGMVADEGFLLRMSGVRRAWRAVLVGQRGLWRRLVLGRKRPEKKAKLWVERSGSRLGEVVVHERFEAGRADEVGEMLRDVIGGVKGLELRMEGGKSDGLVRAWRGRCKSLERLVVDGGAGGARMALANPLTGGNGGYGGNGGIGGQGGLVQHDAAARLDLDLLSYDAMSLTHLELKGRTIWQLPRLVNGHLQHAQYDPLTGQPLSAGPKPVTESQWLDDPKRQLANLRTLRLDECMLVCSERADRRHLFRYMPGVREVRFASCIVRAMEPYEKALTAHRSPTISDEAGMLELPQLVRYSDTGSFSAGTHKVFETVCAPALLHLALYAAPGPASPLAQLLAPGLESALPHLQSLDVGKTALDLPSLLGALKRLPALRFLCVAHCGLENAFLDAIARPDEGKGQGEGLLPQLVGLSIAGSDAVTPGGVRDFVKSRLPFDDPARKERSVVTKPASTRVASSAFRPSAPLPLPLKKGKGKSRADTPSQNSQPIPSQPSATTLSRIIGNSKLPKIEWLNIDNCERLDPPVIAFLRKKVKVVLSSYGVVDERRVRGVGKWGWELAVDGCVGGGGVGAEGEGANCQVRRVPGTKDDWYIAHVCDRRADEVWDEGNDPGWELGEGDEGQRKDTAQGWNSSTSFGSFEGW